ncbi:hypothetical protein SK128_007031 [Halocaridina rubra]|uniref:BHLH domain-containing protein n=1 Tax=Halocaridina rubra TaxID=373956 RepID=A0AAN8WX35_HALRR
MTKNKAKKTQKSDNEKKMFSKWEAARRHRFNYTLEKLRLSMPECNKKSKAEIVESAEVFIQKLKAFKESVVNGNGDFELKREIKQLKRQVIELKHMNSLLIKLIRETGLKIESRNDGKDILCTIPVHVICKEHTPWRLISNTLDYYIQDQIK